ncbi:MAG: hypothetical protein EPO35_02745 [Acidobacteria bacterium]|nr:MAG: hypothetical protein EPO35_02745 [Acidobacteriota bacterium]
MTGVFLSLFLLVGQTADAWSTVMALAPGRITRLDLDAGSVEGGFVSATADAITLTIKGRAETVARQRVKAVRVRSGPSHRRRNVLIGFGAGVGAGLLLQKATCSGNNCTAEAAFVYTVPLELAGALTGALVPSQSWHVIYQRK